MKMISVRNTNWIKILLLLFLITEFSVLTHVPIPYIHPTTHWGMLILGFACLIYYLNASFEEKHLQSVLWILLPILVIPFVSAIQAEKVFGQHFWFGFIADRDKFFILSPLILMYMLDKKWITLKMIEKTLIGFSFVYFILVFGLYLFVDPEVFMNVRFAKITLHKGVLYNLNKAPIVILFLYGIYQSAKKKDLRFIPLLVAILVFLLFFAKARALCAILFITTLHLLVFQLSAKERNSLLKISTLTAVLLGVTCYLFFREKTEYVIRLFSNAITVFSGQEVSDSSSNSRVAQADIAWEGFQRHYLLGNGYLSSQWNKGFRGQFSHFFPSDIGWLGVLYLNGIVGFLILNVPFVGAVKQSIKIPDEKKDLFYRTMTSFVLFLFLHGIFAGIVIKRIGIIAFSVAIIYFYNRYRSNTPDFSTTSD